MACTRPFSLALSQLLRLGDARRSASERNACSMYRSISRATTTRGIQTLVESELYVL